MHKNVFSSIIGCDEAKALLHAVKFNSAAIIEIFPFKAPAHYL